MAQDINIKMTLTDGGTVDARVSDAKRLNKELEKTEATTERINKANSRPKSASAALERSGMDPKQLTEYNTGTTSFRGGSGGSREFAAQAQGLGGLVRLYATFAANIFAVTTAFNALKQAANTEKMIQASERFSATVGVNLRSVSKDLQEATQYSLSFQDAVKFTNIGTAAGLAAKDIKNLTVIAKGAATALGRDVGESIQRIIQGTAKQEQEILDELGIFIKSKKAFEEYAAARNMKADDLTATQRTLAYAEAVAKAGEKWKEFANIDDPFGRLSAELQNTLNQVLSTVNKVAAPIAAFFADNSKAILALAALITTSLVQRALPELKTALLSSITFDSQRAKLAAAELRTSLTQELAEVSRRAEDAAKKLKDFQSTSVDLANRTARGNIVKGSIPKEFLASKNESGLNAGTIGTALFSPKNLANIKTFQDAQEAVLSTVREQLKDQDKQTKVMQDLVNKGVLTKESTAQNLVLTQESNKAVAALYSKTQDLAKKQEESNRLSATALATDKERLAVNERLAKAGGAVKVAPATSNASLAKDAATALEGVVVAGTRAERTAQNVANSVGKSIALSTAFAGSFSKVSKELADTRIAAAGEGIFAQFKAAGATLVGMNANIATATAGITGFGKAGATAGAIAASSLGAVRLALGGVMAALGPIMLAWTVWELAGPWIKETFFGINQELEKLKDKAKETNKELQDSFVIMEKTFNKANAVLVDPAVSTQGIVKSLEAKSNALRTILDAIQKEKEAKKSVADFKAPGAVNSKISLDAKAGDLLNASQSIVFLSKELGVSGAQVEAFSKKYYELQERLKNSDGSVRSTRAITVALTELAALKDKLDLKSVLEANEAVLQRQEALYTKAAASAKALGDAVDDSQILAKAEAKGAGFATTAEGLKAFKGTKEFTSAGESLRTLSAEGLKTSAVAEETAKSVVKLGKAAVLLNIPTSALNPVIAKSNELLAINSSLLDINAQKAKASKEGNTQLLAELNNRAAALATRSEQISKELGAAITDGASKDAKAIFTALSAATNATSQYTTEAKNAFKELEQQINAAEAALKALNATLDVNQKLNGLRASFTGQQNLENNLIKDKLVILQQEYDIEAKKAFLAREKVRLAKDTRGDKGAQAEAEFSYQSTLKSLEATRQQKALLLEIDTAEKNRNENIRLIEERTKLAADAADRSLATAKLQFDLEKAYGDARATALGLTQEETRYESLLLEQQEKRLEAAGRQAAIQRELSANIAKVNEGAKAEVTAKAATFASTAVLDPRDKAAAESTQAATLAEIEKSRLEQIQKITEEAKRKLETDKEQASIAEELMNIEKRKVALLAQQASQSEKLAKLNSSISGLFKGTGVEKQAKAITDILKVTQTSAQKMAKFEEANKARKEKNVKELQMLTERSMSGVIETLEEEDSFRKKIGEEDKKATQERKYLELDATAESLNSFKGLFDEKTAAYKIMDSLERGIHAFKMGSMIAELAMTQATVAPTIAAESAKNTVKGVGAILSALTAPWPMNFVAGAAMAVIVASLLGGGSKKVNAPGGMNAEDKQKTQGTGMSWVNGQKVENGNGVFGDSEAKSESIKNSLEIIADNTIEGLGYDKKMLKALEGLTSAIGSTAKSLFTVQGVRSGSAFGTPESSVSTKGWKGLWGSSTTRDLVDSGIKITGAFAQLAKGLGQFSQYETIQKTEKKSGFLGIGSSTRISYETNAKELDSAVKSSITDIFANATKLFTEIGQKTGSSVESTLSKLSSLNVNFEASLKGLTGKELEEALNATISQALDAASNTLFGAQFKKYQEFGEGLLETVVRVVDSNDKIKVALDAIGNSSVKWANLSFDVTESMVKSFGGLDKFTDSIESFRDNFLTEAERIAPVAKNVTDTMKSLGFGFVDTREEFKLLVQSLDLAVPAQREVYLSLMQISESFAKVYEDTSKALEPTEYRNRLLDQELTILELLGKKTEAISISRQKEIEELEKLGTAQSAQLIYNQKVIWALEDALEVRSAEAELLGTLGRTYEQVVMQREEELRNLTDNLKVLKKAQFAAEDYNNSQSLMIELMRLEGKEKQATALVRQNELKGLSQVDKAIKSTIFAMEDEAALREELKTAREEENQTLEGVISKTKDYIKSLKDYRSSLLIGNLSILSPAQKYEEAKAKALELAAKASGPATTKAEIEARDNARSGLQSATSAWLEASRTLFASSEGYVTDFNKVLELLDQSSIGATEQLTEAEKQLKALNDSIAVQNSIEQNTQTSAELLKQIADSQAAAAQFKSTIPANLAEYYGLDKLNLSISSLSAVLDAAVASVQKPVVTPIVGLPEKDPVTQAIVDGIKTIPSFKANSDSEELKKQIASLQTEIKGLREDNVDHTTALIEAGYRSNIDNAEAVNSGISTAFDDFQWREANRVQLR